MTRLWARDASVWANQDEAKWLGWLDALDARAEQPRQAPRAGRRGPRREVHARAPARHGRLEPRTGSARHHVRQAARIPRAARARFHRSRAGARRRIPRRPRPHARHRRQQVRQHARAERLQAVFLRAHDRARSARANAGKHFVAITDPGSKMQKVAEGDGFRHIFFGEPTIGGRYSALSPFGLVPAAVIGLDVDAFLASTARMAAACAANVEGDENPGLVLGALLGVAATQGRDKLTLIASPGIVSLGAWLEQLIAESTGKDGKAIIPVDLEAARRSRALRRRPRVRVSAPRRPRPIADQDALADALVEGGAAGRPHRRRRHVVARPGVLPLGDRDGGGGRGAEDQSVQSARRRGEQDRDARADHRLRARRRAAGGNAAAVGRRADALHRWRERRCAAEGGAGGHGGIVPRGASRASERRRLSRAARRMSR